MTDYQRPRQPLALGQRVYGRNAFGVVVSLRPGLFGAVKVRTDTGRVVRGSASQFSTVAENVGRA